MRGASPLLLVAGLLLAVSCWFDYLPCHFGQQDGKMNAATDSWRRRERNTKLTLAWYRLVEGVGEGGHAGGAGILEMWLWCVICTDATSIFHGTWTPVITNKRGLLGKESNVGDKRGMMLPRPT